MTPLPGPSQDIAPALKQRILPELSDLLLELDIDPDQIKTIRPYSRRSHYRAIVNWLRTPQMEKDGSNLASILGALEAFDHLCTLEEWQKAGDLLSIELNTLTEEPLHIQLETWGYDKKRIELFSQIVGKLDKDWDSIWLNGLGNSYLSQGDYHKALAYHQQQLAIAQHANDLDRQAVAYCGLGNIYEAQGRYADAIVAYETYLSLVVQKTF